MYILIIILPFIGFLLTSCLGNNLGRKGASFLSIFSIGYALFLSFFVFYEVGINGIRVYCKCSDWIVSGVLVSGWGFLFDTLTCVMLIVVLSISLIVHIYSTQYMMDDPHLIRFMSYLSLFTFFMLCLVTADNFLQIFLGWEGVGLASYLLINFWFTRVQANKAALKAVIVNRIGDLGITIAIVLLYKSCKSVNLLSINGTMYVLQDAYFTFLGCNFNIAATISFLLFIGAIGKSAQLGLHTWLPDAMEGPTPVSALIHAATMVTAGVFVLVRCSGILEYCSDVLVFIGIIGALTAFFAGTVGVFQNDLKRVIAYSTCSQLGYMVISCGLSEYVVSMYHLVNHAFFKALLFLCAGCVIHGLNDEQDLRRMGGLYKLLPLSYIMMFIGSMSLMGFPFTTGFYSKEFILELAKVNFSVSGFSIYLLGFISAMCTALYSMRALFLTFWCETNIRKGVLGKIHEGTWVMLIPLILLTIASIFLGYITRDMFVGMGTNFWNNSVLIFNYTFIREVEAEMLPASIKLLPLVGSIFGGIFMIYVQKSINVLGTTNEFLLSCYKFYNKKWYFDILYNYFIVYKILKFSYEITFKTLDRGVLEIMGPTGIIRVFENIVLKFMNIHTGFIYHYIFLMILGIIGVLFITISIAGSWWDIGSSLLLLLICIMVCELFIEEKNCEKNQ